MFSRRLDYEGAPAVLIAVIDITERKEAEARIAHMAHHDALTDLPNRVLFRQRMADALAQRSRTGNLIGALCIDLDNFKLVNDTLGHPIGDRLLQDVAARIERVLRTRDTAARLGGDEFAVLVPEMKSPQELAVLAQRLIEVVSEPYVIDGHMVTVGSTIGIAVAPADGNDADHLLRNADLALYRAKAAGKSTFRFFEPEMDAQAQARRQLEIDLRAALAGRNARGPLPAARRSERARRSSASRRCCAGRTRRAGSFRRPSSYPSPRKPASSRRSATTCWSAPAPTPASGPTRQARRQPVADAVPRRQRARRR